MLTHRFGRALRLASALAVAAAILFTSLGRTSSADAAARPLLEEARIHVSLKSVYLYADHDPGDGEMQLELILGCWAAPTSCNGNASVNLDIYRTTFNASDGDTVVLDRLVPEPSDFTSPWYDASADRGYPLYPGQRYQINIRIDEQDDDSGDDALGQRAISVTHENGWAVGTHKLRSTKLDGADGDWGDFEIEFEVRKVALPDLRPLDVKLEDLPGSAKKRACIILQNAEATDAGPFELALKVDGAVPPGGRVTIEGLPPGPHLRRCMDIDPPAPGQHRLAAVVDEPRAIPEYNEANNVYEVSYTATPPTATPSASPADLVGAAILVNGQVPDGKDDCKAGKNAVAVVVKNAGKDTAGLFATRLTIDGVDVAEQSTVDLATDKEQEVRFEGVQLKKGEHKLTALADANRQVAETDENNNALTVTVRC